jgi:hypothetical protein
MRSSTSAIWRVECLAGALHNQLWQCWPSGRLAATAVAHCFKVDAPAPRRMDAAVAASSSASAAATSVGWRARAR